MSANLINKLDTINKHLRICRRCLNETRDISNELFNSDKAIFSGDEILEKIDFYEIYLRNLIILIKELFDGEFSLFNIINTLLNNPKYLVHLKKVDIENLRNFLKLFNSIKKENYHKLKATRDKIAAHLDKESFDDQFFSQNFISIIDLESILIRFELIFDYIYYTVLNKHYTLLKKAIK